MQDHVRRLVGLDRLVVMGVVEVGAGGCSCCGRDSIDVKKRPVVRGRDLPIAGRHLR